MRSFCTVVSKDVAHEVEYQPEKGNVNLILVKKISMKYLLLKRLTFIDWPFRKYKKSYIKTIARFHPDRSLTITPKDEARSHKLGRLLQQEL